MNNAKKTPPVLGTQPGDVIKWSDVDHDTQYHGLYPAQFRAAAAEWYTARGLEVGPLRGKVPMPRYVPHGKDSFTADVPTVQQWWAHTPGANIGLRPPAGYVVVDVDVKDGAPGAQTWAELNAGRSVPDTLTMITGTGGWHLWFRLPFNATLRGQLAHTSSGVDLKTRRGYVVVAPSVHPDGGMYRLHTWMELEEVPELPVWLHRHAYKPVEVTPAPQRHNTAGGNGSGLIEAVASAPAGNRNNTLIWAACRNAEEALGMDEELVQAATRAGLPEAEARRTIASGARMYSNGGGAAA
ncbi:MULTISPECIES: bifunctional DNA primase/polymerase [unclassified Corynebacterium]|uniref:bifunctional DNA primase/polymerase n=1 Tax=unclassified Corynebacterium TaxID=2624378 RepID=UPI000B1C028D|nr:MULTISPECIES: bifunctional DNA primase/polymerase [unclassified Corynebacterium]MDK8880247.1 bifunctional DNA primase/polymerase [Corynebacterium sp. MSK008]